MGEIKRKIESDLLKWKHNADRKPLILGGARQVGKTHTMLHFAKTQYSDYIYVDFETNPVISRYFKGNIEPSYILSKLESHFKKSIIPGKTLIIFDEIEQCGRALTSLKYFAQDAPEHHIMCAGSLLGVAIKSRGHSFPVGNVDGLTLHPLDFEEFLWANEETALADFIRESFDSAEPLDELLHSLAIEYYFTYLETGGMPACVNSYLVEKNPSDAIAEQNRVISNTFADIFQYADGMESMKIRMAYESIPAQLSKDNKKFQYKVAKSGGSASYFGTSIEWLVRSGIVNKCQRIERGSGAIKAYADLSSFKLYMADTGLLNKLSGLSQDMIVRGDEKVFRGMMAENYVSQALTANGFELNYWTSGNKAELDFVLQKAGKITAIEVKSGTHTRSRSLDEFLKLYSPDEAYRITMKNFGEKDRFYPIPLYATFCIN
ncbi:MAG: DUF4143 domain-containing protein [Candidatus Methanoplasma sp.]|jgi:predicted AAA+ superfamily ATPase|nr:DUF4143 domain-containing protein [Candidatus Methanoplasma sp.]